MGCPHNIKVRAGPHVPPAQRRPGHAPPANVPSRLKIIVILTHGRDPTLSPPLPPGAMPSAPSNHHSRARLLGWTGSRCDSVCLRSRHFEAWHRPGLAHAFPPAQFVRPRPVPEAKPSKNPVISLFTTLKQPRTHRKQATRPARASLRWWTKSRCDSVCLRSRHFVAWLRWGLAHDAIAIQTTKLSNASLN